MEKQHNRGQDGAGIANIKLDVQPGKRNISRERSVDAKPIQDIFGQIKDNTKENGKQVSTMGMVNLPGQMDENISANSTTTKNMDMVYITGQLASLT